MSPFVYLILNHFRLARSLIGSLGINTVCAIFVLSPSTTLWGIVFFALSIRVVSTINVRRILLYSSFAFVLAATVLFLSPSVQDRVFDVFKMMSGATIISHDMNLSALCFIKGMQMAIEGLHNYPLGVGILNFQMLNDFSEVSQLTPLLHSMNIYSGTSIAWKMIGEFGYLGLFVIIYSFFRFFKNFKSQKFLYVYERFFLFGLISSFIRGASYIDGVPLLALSVLLLPLSKPLRNLESNDPESGLWSVHKIR